MVGAANICTVVSVDIAGKSLESNFYFHYVFFKIKIYMLINNGNKPIKSWKIIFKLTSKIRTIE